MRRLRLGRGTGRRSSSGSYFSWSLVGLLETLLICRCVLLECNYQWNAGNFSRATLCVRDYVSRVLRADSNLWMSCLVFQQSMAAGDRVFEWWIRQARKVARALHIRRKDVSNLRMWASVYARSTSVETLELVQSLGRQWRLSVIPVQENLLLWTCSFDSYDPTEWSDLDWWQKHRVTLIDVVFEARWGLCCKIHTSTGTIASNEGLTMNRLRLRR